MSATLKAISIRQPWAWAIANAGKNIENRDWPYSPGYRGPVLIHAAKGCGRAEFDDAVDAILDIVQPAAGGERLELLSTLAKMHVPLRGKYHGEGTWRPVGSLPFGGFVARARLVSIVQNGDEGHGWGPAKPGRVCAWYGSPYTVGARVSACPRPNRWAVPGQLGLVLADVEPLPALIPWKGALGLFDAADALEALARAVDAKAAGMGASHG